MIFLFSNIDTDNNNNENDVHNSKLNTSSSNKPFHLAINNRFSLSLFLFDTVDCLIMMMMKISYRITFFDAFIESIISLTTYRIKKPCCGKFDNIIYYNKQPSEWFIVDCSKSLVHRRRNNIYCCCDCCLLAFVALTKHQMIGLYSFFLHKII